VNFHNPGLWGPQMHRQANFNTAGQCRAGLLVGDLINFHREVLGQF